MSRRVMIVPEVEGERSWSARGVRWASSGLVPSPASGRGSQEVGAARERAASARPAPSGRPAWPRAASCTRRASPARSTSSVVRRILSTVVISRSTAVEAASTGCSRSPRKSARRRGGRRCANDRLAQVLGSGRRAAGLQVDHVQRHGRRLDRVQRRQRPGRAPAPAPPRRAASAPRSARRGASRWRTTRTAPGRRRRSPAPGRTAASCGRPPSSGPRVRSASPRREGPLRRAPSARAGRAQALGERRHPPEGAEADHERSPARVAAKESSTWLQPFNGRRARRA